MLQYQRINRLIYLKFRPNLGWSSSVNRTFQTNSDQPNSPAEFEFAKLSNKCIISLYGTETLGFLQGIVTNDVRHLTEDQSTSVQQSCIYSFILNNTGRILADLFLYKFHDNDNLILLEVDKRIKDPIIKLLKRYRVKKQITITTEDSFKSYVCFSNQCETNLPNQRLEFNDSKSKTIWTLDPRNYHFGFKILTTSNSMNPGYFAKLLEQNSKCANLINPDNITETDPDFYRSFRYNYGIAEGPDDLTPEICFPLEANGDILNGISFHKGCYVGQELTTRTFHTGVIRKRIMPIKILKKLYKTDLLPSQNVVDDQGKQVGRFRCNFADSGLALLKFNNIPMDIGKQKIKLSISQHPIYTWRPFWWPNSLM